MTTREVRPLEPRSRERREVVRLVRRIQAFLSSSRSCGAVKAAPPELQAKERTLEQLRWRLAAAARRSASDDLDDAA